MISFVLVSLGWLVLGLGVGYLYGVRRTRVPWLRDVRKLEAAVEETSNALKSARMSEVILRSLRDGELGVDDLKSIDFELPPAVDPPEVEVSERYQPFRRLPYLRDIKTVGQMIPGDETWISLAFIRHRRHDAALFLRRMTPCGTQHSSQRARVRCLADSSFEIATDPGDTALPLGEFVFADPDSIWLKHVTVLRKQDRYVEGRT
jgi:hypothetical protein